MVIVLRNFLLLIQDNYFLNLIINHLFLIKFLLMIQNVLYYSNLYSYYSIYIIVENYFFFRYHLKRFNTTL